MLNLLAFDVANAAKSVIGIGALVFVHELGHFLVGRACSVRAEAFSIGFGPVLAKWKPGETEYRISAIPLGGYVKFLGENPDERGDRDPRSFFAATYPRKVAIMLAGVTMNVLAAFVLFVCAYTAGVEVTPPVIGSVVAGSPAAEAGLRPGDRIVTIDGKRIVEFGDVVQEVGFAESIGVVVEREGARLPSIRIVTALREDGIRQLGVSPAMVDDGRIFPAPDSRAERAGVQADDRIVDVGGAPAASLEAAWALHEAAKAPTVWTLDRAGERVRVEVPATTWRLGVVPKQDVPNAPSGILVSRARTAGAAPPEDDLPAEFRILSVDGRKVTTTLDVRAAAATAGEESRTVTVRWTPPEGGETRESAVRPVEVPADDPGEFGILVRSLTEEVQEENVFAAAALGVERTHRWVMRILTTLRSLISGDVSATNLQGPIAIARMTYATADTGWPALFIFLGMISMNLAVLNVLPVPLLDGGQLALITAEKIRGRPLPERVLEGIQWSGLILLLSFMAFVIVNDIRRM